jgi:hypothetical protein
MGTALSVIAYYAWTSDGLITLAKCIYLNEMCSFAILLQSVCHGKSVTESSVKNILHLQCYVKIEYTKLWKNFEQQIQWWTKTYVCLG